MNLEGRYAVITGGSQGFGLRIALRFVREGAAVLVCARDAAQLERARADIGAVGGAGARVIAQPADVTRESDLLALRDRALSEFPQVDILVNCAGVAGPRGAVDDVDWDEWKQAIAINLNGTVFASLAFLPHMKQRRRGKIIIVSGGGATKPLPHLSAYAASKAGVVRFGETLAEEVRGFGIDVNAVAPGVLATRMMDHFLEGDAGVIGREYIEEAARQRADAQPAFDRAAALCVFLASAESDGITGKLISAGWDPWRDLPKHKEDLAKTDVYTLRRIVPADRGLGWGGRSR